MKFIKFMTIIFASLIFSTRMAEATNLIIGGGFEDPKVNFNQYLLNATPLGWSGTGDMVKQGYAGAVSSGEGNQWFDLNPGTSAGTGISQDLLLNTGTTYQFSFLYNGGGGGSTTRIDYLLASNTETFLSGSVFTSAMNVYGGTPWNNFSASFTPLNGGLGTLHFMPNGTWSGGFIDNVNLSPIPEPSTLWLMLSGLTVIVLFSRRKIKETTVKLYS